MNVSYGFMFASSVIHLGATNKISVKFWCRLASWNHVHLRAHTYHVSHTHNLCFKKRNARTIRQNEKRTWKTEIQGGDFFPSSQRISSWFGCFLAVFVYFNIVMSFIPLYRGNEHYAISVRRSIFKERSRVACQIMNFLVYVAIKSHSNATTTRS